jgi:hypothetical protein
MISLCKLLLAVGIENSYLFIIISLENVDRIKQYLLLPLGTNIVIISELDIYFQVH